LTVQIRCDDAALPPTGIVGRRQLPRLGLRLDGRGGGRAQIVRAVAQAIAAGAIAPGDRLPSTRALAAQLGIARVIVLEAYDELIARGLAIARRGAGTFVAPA
jgi:GntR family transcriptional regulator/MocR family aminotransferase